MRQRATDGFTLLELLLAIGLLALITSSILGGLHLGRRAWESTRASEAIDDVENSARALAAQLSRAYPVTPAKPSAAPTVIFRGLANAFRGIVLSEGGAQWGGLIVTEVGSIASPNGADLAVWTRVYRETEGPGPTREDMRMTILLHELDFLELSYFGSVEKRSPPVWTNQWVDRSELPILISFKIGAKRLGRTVSASMIVPIRQR
jgi:general secretion pathway protein J